MYISSTSKLTAFGKHLFSVTIMLPLFACHQTTYPHTAHNVATTPVQSYQQPLPTSRANTPKNHQISYQPNQLSFGAVKKHLRIGISSQSDVIRLLGSPNNMTINGSGLEIWIYDRIHTELASDSHRSNAGINIGFGGFGSSSIGGLGFNVGESGNHSKMISATKTLTVILEFDQSQILRELLVREGRY